MTDKQIIYNCPHISLTDWGTYACKLYNPRDKNCLVKGGNCNSNISCPYKLKAENERLQEEREKAKNYNLEYGKLLIKATNKNNKLSKTLAEIKEIAKYELNNLTESAINGGRYVEILQKISESEEV